MHVCLLWQRTACYRKVTTAGELDNLLLPGFAEGKACGDTEQICAMLPHILKSAYPTIFPATYLAALKTKASFLQIPVMIEDTLQN